MDVEKDKELALAVLEKDKELALAVLEKDKELALAVLATRHEFEVRSLVALRCRDLSALSKRVLLEGVFRIIVTAVPKSKALKEALNATSVYTAAKNLIRAGDLTAKMSAVNECVLNDCFRALAWDAVGLDRKVPFPSLPGELLYGDLSASLHSPALREVYLSDLGDPTTTAFFTAAARLTERFVTVFSEQDAAAAAAAANK